MSKILGLDFDGVIADFLTTYIEFINEKFNTDFKISDVTGYNITKALGIDANQEELFQEFSDKGGYRNLKPIEDAVIDINLLRNYYKVGIITARNIDLMEDSLWWLDKYGIAVDFFEPIEDKLKFCKIYGVTHFVDDKPENCINVSRGGIKTYIFDRPSNKGNYDDVKRVYSWKELYRELVRESSIV